MNIKRHNLLNFPLGHNLYEVTNGSEPSINGFYAATGAGVLSACLNEHYGRHIGFKIAPFLNRMAVGPRPIWCFGDADEIVPFETVRQLVP